MTVAYDDEPPPPGDEHAPPEVPWDVSYGGSITASIETARRRRNGAAPHDRVPPHDLDAEEALLGAILLDAGALQTAREHLRVTDWYKPLHRAIYGACVALADRGEAVDAVTVAAEMRGRGDTPDLAGLNTLMAGTPAISNAPVYARIIAECARGRELVSAALELRERGYATDLDGAAATLERAGAITAGSLGSVRPLDRSMIGALVRDGVPAPTMVHDWLYAGGLHSLQAEPEGGKSWLALQLSLEVAPAYSVIYLDEEGGEELVAERLAALSADPALIDERFFYFPFPSRSWGADDLAAFGRVVGEATSAAPSGLGLVVLDSLPDFLEAAGKDEDKARDVTRFVKTFLDPVRPAGAGLLVLDHLVKPDAKGERKNGRYARGSGAKLAKTHLSLLLETVTPFDRGTSGQLRLYRTKDRRGAVALPRLGTSGLLIDVKVGDGRVQFVPSAAPAISAWNGPTECMEAVEHLLNGDPKAELSARVIASSLRDSGRSYRDATIRQAADRLFADGRCTRREGPRHALLYSALDQSKDTNDDEPMF